MEEVAREFLLWEGEWNRNCRTLVLLRARDGEREPWQSWYGKLGYQFQEASSWSLFIISPGENKILPDPPTTAP